jgi:hypothetical protein
MIKGDYIPTPAGVAEGSPGSPDPGYSIPQYLRPRQGSDRGGGCLHPISYPLVGGCVGCGNPGRFSDPSGVAILCLILVPGSSTYLLYTKNWLRFSIFFVASITIYSDTYL